MLLVQNHSTEYLQYLCGQFEENNRFKPEMYTTYDVKRGLRNADGTGVRAGDVYKRQVQEISKAGKNIFQEGYEGSVWPAGQNDFALGNQATILCGTWIPVELKDMVDSNWDWGYFPFPTVEGGAGTEKDMEAYLIGFCIPNGAKNVEGAKDFLKYVSSEKNAQGLIDDALCMHARKGLSLIHI